MNWGMIHPLAKHLCGNYENVGPPMIMGLHTGRSSAHEMHLSREKSSTPSEGGVDPSDCLWQKRRMWCLQV